MIQKFAYQLFLTAAAILGLNGYAVAHHSAVAFDKEKTVEVSGEVTRFVWRNPHMAINMEVTNASGEAELWKIEGPGTTVLSRQGFNRSSINNGDSITRVPIRHDPTPQHTPYPRKLHRQPSTELP